MAQRKEWHGARVGINATIAIVRNRNKTLEERSAILAVQTACMRCNYTVE
jgi:hypothetical protein